jgi:mono/diheme cytochrome c family protein
MDNLRGVPFKDTPETDGARLFLGSCASCHSFSGQGNEDGYYPSLMKNSVVAAEMPNNLLNVILHGVSRKTNESEVFMPGFSDTLSDKQIATLSTYIMKEFGAQPALNVKDQDVADLLREMIPQTPI